MPDPFNKNIIEIMVVGIASITAGLIFLVSNNIQKNIETSAVVCFKKRIS